MPTRLLAVPAERQDGLSEYFDEGMSRCSLVEMFLPRNRLICVLVVNIEYFPVLQSDVPFPARAQSTVHDFRLTKCCKLLSMAAF